MQQEEVKEIPLIYPLMSFTLRTVQMVDGRPVESACEEIINMKEAGNDLPKRLNKLVNDWRTYLKKIRETVESQPGRDALQNTLDKHSQDRLRRPEDRPSSPAPEADPDQGSLPLDPPAALPESASL